MLNLSKLFGQSPFSPLRSHMEKVYACMKKLKEMIDKIDQHLDEDLLKLSEGVSQFEHEADLTKNHIRNHLPVTLFLPIDRSQLLEILSIQDSIADQAEDIASVIMLKPLYPIADFFKDLKALFDKNFEVFLQAYAIMKELDTLLEASFGGIEAQKVKVMADQTAYKEYESDLLKNAIMRSFFQNGSALSPPDFYQWIKLIEAVGSLSHLSEKLAMRIRLLLEIAS